MPSSLVSLYCTRQVMHARRPLVLRSVDPSRSEREDLSCYAQRHIPYLPTLASASSYVCSNLRPIVMDPYKLMFKDRSYPARLHAGCSVIAQDDPSVKGVVARTDSTLSLQLTSSLP